MCKPYLRISAVVVVALCVWVWGGGGGGGGSGGSGASVVQQAMSEGNTNPGYRIKGSNVQSGS